ARPHALRQRRRPLSRAAVPRRAAERVRVMREQGARGDAALARTSGAGAAGEREDGAPCGPPRRRGRWGPCVRVGPSRFPPIDLLERVADPRDYDAVFAIESLTNTRLRDEVGELSLVPAHDRVSGPGASWIMAPFTHIASGGGRFSTASFGAYYCARTLE